MLASEHLEQYEALQSAAVVARVSNRTHLELAGADRASFFHGLCTADIKRLAVGTGTEAFLCNLQGKVLGFVQVFCGADTLTLETAPGQGAALFKHLDRYLIREKVVLRDWSGEWSELIVAGPAAGEVLAPWADGPLPTGLFEHVERSVAGQRVSIRRVDSMHAKTLVLAGPSGAIAAVDAVLQVPVVARCGAEVLEVARVERGVPEYGRDISEENLPQEVARDERAISFTKGCYLGQETVARIDALGHVNWSLAGLVLPLSAEGVAAGSELTRDGKPLARVTSVVYSPRQRARLALAYVRRGSGSPGTTVASDAGPITIVRLPLS